MVVGPTIFEPGEHEPISMPDHLTPEGRTDLMRSVRRTGTAPELAVRKALAHLRVRYRTNPPPLPGRPDLVLLSRRVAVFVHGCFWHRHPSCRRASLPVTRRDYWTSKFQRNIERDVRVQSELMALGWRVIVVWECETLRPGVLDERLKTALGLEEATHSKLGLSPGPE